MRIASLIVLLACTAAIPATAQTGRIAARSHSAHQATAGRDADHFGIVHHRDVQPQDTLKAVTKPAKAAPAKTTPNKRIPAKRHVRRRTAR